MTTTYKLPYYKGHQFCCQEMINDLQAAEAVLKADDTTEPKINSMQVTDGFRTKAQQADLIKRSRLAARSNSLHLKGQAVDLAFNGKTMLESNGKATQFAISVYRKVKRILGDHNFTGVGVKDAVHWQWTGVVPSEAAAEIARLNGPVKGPEMQGGNPEEVYLTSDTDNKDLQKEHESLNSRGLYDPAGLDIPAWYDDDQSIVGNKNLMGSPVSFSINLREFDFNQPLPSADGSNDPLTILLNCSLSSVKLDMKHIINKTNTRTGFHLTFWGMEPDTITGSGSTGVFMNQFGLASIMSLNKLPTDLMKWRNSGGDNQDEEDSVGEDEGDMKVAAQDAFVELLATFRNNGIIRYQSDSYDPTDTVTNRDQVEQSTWSEKYGDSSYTRNARNNDVMIKGSVLMRFKSNLYYGYFKSLQWSMEADNPYQWKFDFTFQVQKTVSFVFYTG